MILAGSLCVTDDLAVEALLYPFFAPHSYTGEDLVELHVCVASCVVEVLVERFLASGCRTAGPGEFTARAYLNGKLDLAQAEAVNEVIGSSNTLQLDAAERLLAGRLTKTAEEIRLALLDTLSSIEAGLDFSGEDIEFIGMEQAAVRLADIQRGLEELLAGSIRYEGLMDLPAVGIAGAPNAGKSSLLNALLGWERSIVSPQPKTTRDVLTGLLYDAGGFERDPKRAESRLGTSSCPWAVLFDCAGLVPAPDNVLDELAQRAAIEALDRCTVVLFCVDSAKSDWSEDLAIRTLIRPKSLIHVATKSDLMPAGELPSVFGAEFLPVSTKTGEGLESLLRMVRAALSGSVKAAGLGDGAPGEHQVCLGSTEAGAGAVALTARHRQAVTEALENVRQAVVEVRRDSGELAAMMIRAACQAISGIEQEHLDEQVLDRIFSRFCVGK